MINKVILVGNVGQDPTITKVNENQVAKLTLATSESYKNKDGERVTQTEWHNVVFWGGLSKVVEQYVKKGSQIYIEGKITNRSYEKDGQTKYFTEIVAKELKMFPKKDSSNSISNGTYNPDSSNQSNNQYHASNEFSDVNESDDLPF